MPEYQKSNSVSGNWIVGKEVRSGSKAKLKSEVAPMKSQFKDKNGNDKNQDVGKILIQGDKEMKNISINRATLNGLIEAFGTNSKDWVDKLLTVETIKVSVGGKMQTALYLIPEGFELTEDANGYMVVTKVGEAESVVDLTEDEENIDESQIPF